MKNDFKTDVADTMRTLSVLLAVVGVTSVFYALVDLLTRVPNITLIPLFTALMWFCRNGEISTYGVYREDDREDPKRAPA